MDHRRNGYGEVNWIEMAQEVVLMAAYAPPEMNLRVLLMPGSESSSSECPIGNTAWLWFYTSLAMTVMASPVKIETKLNVLVK